MNPIKSDPESFEIESYVTCKFNCWIDKKKGEEFTVELVSLRRRWRRDRSGEGVEAVRESDEEEDEGRRRRRERETTPLVLAQ